MGRLLQVNTYLHGEQVRLCWLLIIYLPIYLPTYGA
jgi:hypothetical protein